MEFASKAVPKRMQPAPMRIQFGSAAREAPAIPCGERPGHRFNDHDVARPERRKTV